MNNSQAALSAVCNPDIGCGLGTVPAVELGSSLAFICIDNKMVHVLMFGVYKARMMCQAGAAH
jgi:hypothetical protein